MRTHISFADDDEDDSIRRSRQDQLPFEDLGKMDSRLQLLELAVIDINEKISPIGGRFLLAATPTTVPTVSPTTEAGLINSGDTAWMLTSTALVLFMTMPGLALYYSGMIREKNVLTCTMQIFTITCLITFLWQCFGYSLAFAPVRYDSNRNPIFGNAERLWLRGLKWDTTHVLAPTIPEALFCAYELMFAIITAALICGSFADRLKYVPMIVFITIWHLIVYCPIAHSVWHPNGFLFQAGALDFAGGNVVHIASGVSGLMTVLVVGNRKGFGIGSFGPHNIVLTFMGMSMLWVGWFGFNAGSALNSGARAGFALLMTHIAAATASLTWMITESMFTKQPRVLGMISGAVAGLVCITPAAGYVDPTGAFFIGFFGGPLCYLGAQLKHHLGFDDALDAFGVHAIGGMVGGVATGFFATPDSGYPVYGVYYAGLKVGGYQLAMQLYAIAFSIGWSAFFTYIIAKSIDLTIGLRVTAEQEEEGLDSSIHGEKAYDTEKDLVAGIRV